MRNLKRKSDISPSKEIAYIAVTCALLIGGQYVFSFIAGVEIVTIMLISFSYTFGIRRGVILSIAFSLLRCFVFGFYITVIILYLVYYPLLSAVFGALGKVDEKAFKGIGLCIAVNCLLIAIAAACALVYFLDLIKISRLYKTTVNVMLWIVFALCAGMFASFDGLLIAKKIFGKEVSSALKLITFASVAAVCTIIFTLLDDVITPLCLGFDRTAWSAYFYASFIAMLTQTVCAIVTVFVAFIPLTSAMKRTISK